MLQMTAIGLLYIPAIDLFMKLQTLTNILLLPFVCCKKKGKGLNNILKDNLNKQLMKLTNMNEFEIKSFK